MLLYTMLNPQVSGPTVCQRLLQKKDLAAGGSARPELLQGLPVQILYWQKLQIHLRYNNRR